MRNRMKISQIIPAEGWFAKIEGDDGEVYQLPVAFWALWDTAPVQERSGFVSAGEDGLLCAESEHAGTFLGYVHVLENRRFFFSSDVR